MTSDTYNILFIVFLIIGILLAVLAAALFFVFDIRKIISVKTGMAMRKSVKELNEINKKEDNRNRKRYKGRAVHMHRNEREKKLLGDGKEEVYQQAKDETLEIGLQKKETTVLRRDKNEITAESQVTAILDSRLEKQEIEETQITEQSDQPVGLFHITETKIVIFSSEIIAK